MKSAGPRRRVIEFAGRCTYLSYSFEELYRKAIAWVQTLQLYAYGRKALAAPSANVLTAPESDKVCRRLYNLALQVQGAVPHSTA